MASVRQDWVTNKYAVFSRVCWIRRIFLPIYAFSFLFRVGFLCKQAGGDHQETVDAVQVFLCGDKFMVQLAPPWVMGGCGFGLSLLLSAPLPPQVRQATSSAGAVPFSPALAGSHIAAIFALLPRQGPCSVVPSVLGRCLIVSL